MLAERSIKRLMRKCAESLCLNNSEIYVEDLPS